MTHYFDGNGATFSALNDAMHWLKTNGYSYGSLCKPLPVAVMFGEYNLPQKWKNLSAEEKKSVHGKIEAVDGDFRQGRIKVTLFYVSTALTADRAAISKALNQEV